MRPTWATFVGQVMPNSIAASISRRSWMPVRDREDAALVALDRIALAVEDVRGPPWTQDLQPGVEHAISNSGLVDLIFLMITSPVTDGEKPV
jgi:hypothetical protein